jgi:acyl-coenzyme A thioesterase PaaI-like protein
MKFLKRFFIPRNFGAKILKLMWLWPPFFGAGIKLKHIADDYRTIEVEMKLRFWNQNYVGTQFGGSMYAMCDPFFMLILIQNLGKDYIVWDKSATIRFKKPGKGTLKAKFHITQKEIEHIKHQADTSKKVEPHFTVDITDTHGNVIAEVDKLLYVKRKQKDESTNS